MKGIAKFTTLKFNIIVDPNLAGTLLQENKE
jgi:hypothetical protein